MRDSGKWKLSLRGGRLVSMLLLGLLAGGCASVDWMEAADDVTAKRFLPLSGKANIYVYRDDTWGAAFTLPVLMDGVMVGELATKSYVLVEVDPGRYTLQSQADGEPDVEIQAQGGKNYFVWQEVRLGLTSGDGRLSTVSEEAGRAALHQCRRVEAIRPLGKLVAKANPVTSPESVVAPAPASAQGTAPRRAVPGAAADPSAKNKSPKSSPGAARSLVSLLRRPVRGAISDVQVARGTKVEIKGRTSSPEGPWWFVKAGDLMGWVPASDIELLSNTEGKLR
jgi:hypothetical protein